MSEEGRDMETGVRSLSIGEARVARLVAEGLTDEEIAGRLAIGVADVNVELASVLRKLGIRSRTELAFLAPRRGSEGR